MSSKNELYHLGTTSIETAGWSQTFIVFGLISGTLMLIFGFFLRDNPQEKKLHPYGGLPPEQRAEDMDSSAASLSLYQVVKTRSFQALTAIHALGCIGHSVLLAHMVSIATFVGIPSMAAAGILSLAIATSAISRFGMSLVAEIKGC